MGIKCSDLRTYIVRPVLHGMGLYSEAAENLILGTAAQESLMGHYLMSTVPFCDYGIYQINHKSYQWLHDSIFSLTKNSKGSVKYRYPELVKYVKSIAIGQFDEMIYNLKYQTVLCRWYYKVRVKDPLPRYDDIEAIAKYWKQHWNSSAGSGTVEQFVENFKKYVK